MYPILELDIPVGIKNKNVAMSIWEKLTVNMSSVEQRNFILLFISLDLNLDHSAHVDNKNYLHTDRLNTANGITRIYMSIIPDY